MDQLDNFNKMDIVDLKKRVNELKEINRVHYVALKHLGIDSKHLPEAIQIKLRKNLAIQKSTKLNILNLGYLKEWYYLRRREMIELKSKKFQLKSDMFDLDYKIAKEEERIQELRNSLEYFEKNNKTTGDMQRTLLALRKKNEGLKTKTETVNKPPSDFDLDEFIEMMDKIDAKKSNKQL